jgi:Ran GTPase-activating protein (RanGAP) involved in mRNA processing and transport
MEPKDSNTMMVNEDLETIILELDRKRQIERSRGNHHLWEGIWRRLDKVRRNHPTFRAWHFNEPYRCPRYRMHLLLGQALMGNTHLRKLTLPISRVLEFDAQILAQGIGQSKLNCVRIRLMENHQETRVFWQMLYQALQYSQTIQVLRLQRVPNDELANLGATLPLAQSLQRLVVENLVLTEQGAQALAHGIKQSKLQRLELTTGIREQPEASGRIRQIFYQGLRQSLQTIGTLCFPIEEATGLSDTLRLLGIARFKISLGRGNARLLSDLLVTPNSLTHLMLSSGQLDVNGITLLAQALHVNVSIAKLELSGVFIGERGVEILFAHGLRDNLGLTHLKLDDCELDDASVQELVDNWQPNSPICYLSLPRNNIRPDGALRLLGVARHHPALRKLNLSGNNKIGYDGLRRIGESLSNQENLTHVDLSDCEETLSYDASREAHERARQRAGHALLDGVKQNICLTYLKVDARFHWEVTNPVVFYTTLNRMGRSLLLTDHGLPATVWCHILVKCRRRKQLGKSLMFYFLSEQPTLVQPSTQRIWWEN